MDSTETTLVEFCAGYGGIGLGLKRVIPDLRTIAVCEIESFAIENLIAKMEAGRIDACPVWNDLKQFPGSAFHGLVDILSAGFPCQPFSHAGKREGDLDERHLWPYIINAVESIRPRYVFLENVEGLISAKLAGTNWADTEGTPVLLHVLRELERRGYATTWGIFSASEVGAPHQRKRVFILAYCTSAGFKTFGDEYGGERAERFVSESSELAYNSQSGQLRAEKLENKGQDNDRGWGQDTADFCGVQRENELAYSTSIGTQSEPSPRQQGKGYASGINNGSTWPSRPGEPQYEWEPPRVTGGLADNQCLDRRRGHGSDTEQQGEASRESSENSNGSNTRCEVKSPLGGNAHGATDRLDDAELYTSCDNRVDELRLLGNGVVPATAARAWEVLYSRLCKGVAQ